MPDLPKTGKIIVAAPETAVRILDASPASEHSRVYTMPGMNPAMAIVIDLDEINANLVSQAEKRPRDLGLD